MEDDNLDLLGRAENIEQEMKPSTREQEIQYIFLDQVIKHT